MNSPETNAAARNTRDQRSNLVGNGLSEDRISINAGDALRETEIQAAQSHASEEEFSIDELREIARHFRVPDREQIIARGKLVEAIRRQLK